MTGRRASRVAWRIALMLTAGLAPTLVRAQDLSCRRGDVQVHRVSFDGNDSFRDSELANAVATTPSSWSRRTFRIFGARHCLDTLEFQRDLLRLKFFYRQRGYYKTQVVGAIDPLSPSAVAVRFRIVEGVPVIVDTLRVTGLDTLREGERLLRFLRPLEGRVFNRLRLVSAADTVVQLLQDDGFARAEVLRSFDVDTARNRASVELNYLPGRVARVGSIAFAIEPSDSGGAVAISPNTVRTLLSFEEGDIFREQELYRSQRTLYQLEAYQHVEIRPDSLQPPGDTLLNLTVHLSEADMRSIRLGVGWATLDCIRSQGLYIERDFLGGARRLELNARLSKIGVGVPLDGLEGVCRREVRSDRFSDTLNYYLGATFRQPTLFGPRNVPSLTIYSERRSEFDVYSRNTPFGGIASVTREQAPRTPLTVAYQIEYGRTVAEAVVFCSVFNVCTEEDIRVLQQNSRLAVLSAAVERDRTDNAYDPTRGSLARLELRHASTLVGSDPQLQFNKALASVAYYRPVGRTSVLAGRLQVAGVFAEGSLSGAEDFVPPQERLYAGGPNSVRGFQQNQVGPVVYIVDRFDTVTTPDGEVVPRADPNEAEVRRVAPTGGNALVVGNLEFRSRGPMFREVMQWALFVDAGQVRNRRSDMFRFSTLRVTPGVGLRIRSPVGPVRLDLAYNGYRRVSGPAYFEEELGDEDAPAEERFFCVSPDTDGTTTEPVEPADCPPTFRPPREDAFIKRLTFHFSIGQAF